MIIRRIDLTLMYTGWMKPSSLVYSDACCLTLDPDTADIDLILSKDNKMVTGARWQEHQSSQQLGVLCRNGLTGRCYWKVEWKGCVSIGVTYKGINRHGRDAACWVGNKSWMLLCSKDKYSVLSNNKAEKQLCPCLSHRVGVYLDWPAGILCFLIQFRKRVFCLHTFHCTFTEPVYPEFRFLVSNSVRECSVSLCEL